MKTCPYLLSLGCCLFAAAETTPAPIVEIQEGTGPMAGSFTLRWNVGDVPSELVLSDDLGAWLPWEGLPTVNGSHYEALVWPTHPREFYRARLAVLPDAPTPAATTLVDGVSLRWPDSYAAERYSVYIGTTPGVGPGNHTHALHNLCDNELIIRGLDSGTLYYLAVYAVNGKGVTPPTLVLGKVFGAHATVTGRIGLARHDKEGFKVFKGLPGLTLFLRAQPSGSTLLTTTSLPDGRFVFNEVPSGDYDIAWPATTFIKEGDGEEFTVDDSGGPGGELEVTPKAGLNYVIGRVHFNGGAPAVFNDSILNLNQRAQVQARASDGLVKASTQVDDEGVFLFENLETQDYPFQIEGLFKDALASDNADSPGEHGPLDIVFDQQPAEISTVIVTQGGERVPRIDPAQPFQVSPIIEVPEGNGIPSFTWAVHDGAGTVMATSTLRDPVFSLSGPVNGQIHIRGAIETASTPPARFDARFVAAANLNTHFTGRVVHWTPASLVNGGMAPVPAALVRITVGGTVLATVTDASGAFEFTNVPPVGPLQLLIRKSGFAPWVVRFEHQRPSDAEYGLLPRLTTTLQVPAAGQPNTRVLLPDSQFFVELPPGSILRDGAPYAGPITAEHGSWPMNRPASPYPFPPAVPGLPAGSGKEGLWMELKFDDGAELRASETVPPLLVYYLGTPTENSTILHDAAGNGIAVPMAIRYDNNAPQRLLADITSTATTYHLAASNGGAPPSARVEITADRSLNFPFDVLVGNSGFPITVQGPGDAALNIQPGGPDTPHFRVLDPRQAPGLHYTSVDAWFPKAAISKPVVVKFTPSLADFPLFSTEPRAVRLGLGRTLSELTGPPAAMVPSGYGGMPGGAPAPPPWRVRSLEHDEAFLAPDGRYTATASPEGHIGRTYYQLINAPATFAGWRALHSMPANVNDPVSHGTHLTTYYYNLGDLGFARRLTLRQTTGPDGLPNIAMVVSNFRTIDEARADQGILASVCMDYAKHSATDGDRYTKFYTYDNTGALVEEFSLDGAAPKPMPNLCVMCHGGHPFNAAVRNPNLGSSFLPLDLDSFSYNPKVGIEKTKFAAVNKAVLDTQPAQAIRDLIVGWYGNPDPTQSPQTFNGTWTPPSFATGSWGPGTLPDWYPKTDQFYLDTFRASCRICHISRPGGVQFDTFDVYRRMLGPARFRCANLGSSMPATQRTWSTFWGSRAARALEVEAGRPPTVPDMPAQLFGAEPLTTLRSWLRYH